MNLQRMRELRDYLTDIPLKQFNMSTWFSYTNPDNEDEEDVSDMSDIPDKFKCGTTACLAGHAAFLWRDEYEGRTPMLIEEFATNKLELQNYQSREMFGTLFIFDPSNDAPTRRVQLPHAIKMLTYLIEGKTTNVYEAWQLAFNDGN